MANYRVIHISSALSWRGGEQQVAYLISEWLTYTNIAQHVFCAKGSVMQTYCQEQGIAHTTYTKLNAFNPIVPYKLKKTAHKFKATHLHMHDPHAHNFAILAAQLYKLSTPMLLARRVDFPVRNSWYSRYKYNHPQIQRIICVSKAIQRIMQPAIQQPEKVVCIYSGIDPTRFNKAQQAAQSSSLRQKYNIKSKYLIGNVAALAPHKDYPTFIQTAKKIIAQGIDAHFLAFGEGSERSAIENLIVQHKLTAHITLCGFVKNIPQLLPQLHIFLMTSSTEGLGTSILDAMYCCVPVVATKAGGIPEIVQPNITGLLAPVGDANTLAKHVNTLINNKLLRQQLVENAYQMVCKNFTKQATAQKTYALYQNL